LRPASPPRPRPRVAVLEWIDPPFTGGHWVPDLIIAAGGRPVASDAGEHCAPATAPRNSSQDARET
jgi:iron complex transport system substrate-binding protein